MKNNYQNTDRRNMWIVVLLIASFFAFDAHEASAQGYKKRKRSGNRNFSTPSGNIFIGAEASVGNRNFTITSDIAELDNLAVIEEGKTFGGVIGGDAFLIRVRGGSYQASSTMYKRVDLKEFSVGTNINVLQFTNLKPKYFEPYVVFNMDVNNVALYGQPFPERIVEPMPPPPCGCPCCQQPSGPTSSTGPAPGGPPPPNPGAPTPEPTVKAGEVPDTYLGTIKIIRASVGAGLVCNITGKKNFAKLFAEAKYGAGFRAVTATYELQNTNISNQFTMNFGVIMGINGGGFIKK
jgi:hypothetical protein